jgi:hypothetical protein
MNLRAISGLKSASLTKVSHPNVSTAVRQIQLSVSRRRFVQAVAGSAAVGTALGEGLQKSERAHSRWSFAPVPIPSGTPGLKEFYHVIGPGVGEGFDPIDAEPSSITNMDADVGLAYISGNVTRTNRKTGEEELLPFLNSDMRFMKGTFRGTDDKLHNAAFAFV